MNPFLVAILGAVAHADGNTPVLTPLPPGEPTTVDETAKPPKYEFPDDELIEGALIRPKCVANNPRGTPNPMPIANAAAIAQLEADCKKKGGTPTMCDASQMISMASAICASSISNPVEINVAVYTTNVTPRLVWRVQNHHGFCGGTTEYVDGWTADVLGTSGCVYGRPCGVGDRVARARVVRRRGWA